MFISGTNYKLTFLPFLFFLSSSQNSMVHYLFMLQVRAGADYIITQASLNNENLMRFLQKCKEQIEINVPIFLGFFIYDTFDDIIKKCNICKVNIPNDIYKLQGKSNRDIVNFAIDSCNNILIEIEKDEKRYNVGGIHVFTFNRFNLLKEFIGKLRN